MEELNKYYKIANACVWDEKKYINNLKLENIEIPELIDSDDEIPPLIGSDEEVLENKIIVKLDKNKILKDYSEIKNIKNYINLKKNFDGFIINKLDNSLKMCISCNKYHTDEMHISNNFAYCGHCWLWLNENLVDLENNIYQGQGEDEIWDDIKIFIKDTIKLHDDKTCKIQNCIYTRIKELQKNNKLNKELEEYFGYIKKKEINKIIKINKKEEIKINFKMSVISI